MTRTRRLLMLLALASMLAPCGAMAQDGARVVEGQSFPGRVRLLNTELQLNGTGMRAVAWFKGYAVGLYVHVGCAFPSARCSVSFRWQSLCLETARRASCL